jgi:hypothetical protein
MKIFLFFVLILSLKATMLDISKKPYFCINKDLSIGNLHISVEFMGEKEKSSTVQVIFQINDPDINFIVFRT